jgi:hypothetical protein
VVCFLSAGDGLSLTHVQAVLGAGNARVGITSSGGDGRTGTRTRRRGPRAPPPAGRRPPLWPYPAGGASIPVSFQSDPCLRAAVTHRWRLREQAARAGRTAPVRHATGDVGHPGDHSVGRAVDGGSSPRCRVQASPRCRGPGPERRSGGFGVARCAAHVPGAPGWRGVTAGAPREFGLGSRAEARTSARRGGVGSPVPARPAVVRRGADGRAGADTGPGREPDRIPGVGGRGAAAARPPRSGG